MADASVKVVVDAATEKAEENLEQTGDKIQQLGSKSRVSARGVASLVSEVRQLVTSGKLASKAINSLGSAARETARQAATLIAALRRIGNAARSSVPGINSLTRNVDELGDQSVQTAGQLGVLRSAMFTLADATDANVIGLSKLSGAMVTLGPFIAGLVAALVPLVGVLGTVSAALAGVALGMGAIVGAGVVAEMQKIKAAMKSMLKETRKIVAAWGQQFVPLIMDAINAFPTLVKRILNAIVGIDKFVKALRDLGQAAMTIIPAVVHEITRLGAMAIPILRDLAGWMMKAIPKAFKASLRVTKMLGSEFIALGKAAVGLVQQLFRVGTVVLKTLLPAITSLIRLVNQLFRLFTSPPKQFESMLNRLVGALKKVRARSGALWKQLTRLATQLTRLGIIIGGVAAEIVARLMPGITRLIGGIASLINWVNDGLASFVRWASKSKTLQTTFRLLVAKVNDLTKAAQSLYTTGIKPLLPSMSRVENAALNALKTFNALMKGTITFRTALSRLRKTVTRAASDFINLVKTTTKVERSINQLKSQVRPFIKMLRQNLGPALQIVVAGAAIFLTGKLGLLGAAFSAITGAIFTLLGPLKRLVLNSKTLGGVLIRVRNFAGLLGKLLRNLLYNSLSRVKTIVFMLGSTLLGGLLPALYAVWSLIKTKLLLVLGRLGGVVVTLLPSIGAIGTALSGLLTPIALVAGAFVALYIAWKENIFGIRKITKRVFGAIIALLHGDTSKMKSVIGDAVKGMKKLWDDIKKLWKTTKRIFNKIKNKIQKALKWINKNVVQPILNSIMQHWNQHGTELIESVRELMKTIKKIIKFALGIIIKGWKAFGDEILGTARFIFDLVGSVINGFIDGILTAFDVFTDILTGDWDEALQKLKDFAKRIFNGILTFIKKWDDKVIDAIAGVINGIIGWFQDLYDRLIGGSIIPDLLGDILGAVMSWDIAGAFKGALKGALGAIKDMKSAFVDAGKALMQGLKNGIESAKDAVGNTIEGVTDTIGHYMPGSDAEKGALSNLSSYGPTIIKMITQGMLSNLNRLEQAAARVAAATTPGFGMVVDSRGGGTRIDVGGIRVTVDGDRDGEQIGRDIGRGLDDELRSRGFN